jgi:putative phosphoesterase
MSKRKDIYIIGIISDTHGLLRPEAVEAMQGADMIIHAGDIGKESVLDDLRAIAPVIAVRGNMDSAGWANKLRKTEIIELHKTLIYVTHDINSLHLDPSLSHIQVVISGHTHRPAIGKHNSVLYINPGSAGPRRFTLPVSSALLNIRGKSLDAKIITLRT